MDLLDDVFAAMRVSSALHSRLQPSAPWGIRFIRTPSIRFGFMLQGEGWLQVEGHPPQRLQAGGGFIVKPDRQSALFDHAGTPLRWCEEVFADCQGHSVAFGGGGEAAELLCGWLTFNPRGAEPLLSLLPDYVVIPADSQRSPLLAASLQLLELETRDTHLGSRLVVSRLADVLFVQALRAHYQQVEPRQGWVAALADKRLRPVMQRLHEDLAHPWRLTMLAQLGECHVHPSPLIFARSQARRRESI